MFHINNKNNEKYIFYYLLIIKGVVTRRPLELRLVRIKD
jgi:hypothetical protein